MKKKLTDRQRENENNMPLEDKKTSVNDIAKKVSSFFSTEPEREKVLRHEDFDAAGDTYYASVAARYKILQRVLWVAFAVFSIVTVVFNFRYITYDNFFYLIKDFNVAAQSSEMTYETLSYDAATDQSFTLYRGGLAVSSRSKVSAFTATGRRTLGINSSYSKPFSVASEKYLLVYDTGGDSFSIYNSFAKVYTEKLGYPVTDACFSSSGHFAVITRSAEYESHVIVYDEDFRRLCAFDRRNYAVDVSIDENGERVAVLYVDTDSGVAKTVIAFYDLASYEKIDEFEYSGEFPLEGTFFSGGAFGAVTTGTVHIFDRSLIESEAADSYASKRVSAVFCNENFSVVAFNDGVITDMNEIMVFNKNGNLVYNDIVLSDVEQIAASGDYVFVKNSEGVLRVSMKKFEEKQLQCQDGHMLIYDDSTALVCADSKAVYLKFDD